MHVYIGIIHCLGFSTNGEFNSLRWHGINRPLSILQVRTKSRAKYAQKGYKTLIMLTPIGEYMYIVCTLHVVCVLCHLVLQDGSIVAKKSNTCVTSELLQEILQWKNEGMEDLDIITRLRQRTVPVGYIRHTWQPGKPICT